MLLDDFYCYLREPFRGEGDTKQIPGGTGGQSKPLYIQGSCDVVSWCYAHGLWSVVAAFLFSLKLCVRVVKGKLYPAFALWLWLLLLLLLAGDIERNPGPCHGCGRDFARGVRPLVCVGCEQQ